MSLATLLPTAARAGWIRRSNRIIASTINLSCCASAHTEEAGCPGRLVDQISVNIERGESTAFLGRVDSGAEMLVACLRGQVRPSSGRVFVSGAVAFLRIPLVEDLSLTVVRLPHGLSDYDSVVVATQDPQVADRCDRVLVMCRGRIVDDIR